MNDALKAFGLSENEADVYVTLLKAGPATANRVAELTGGRRSTIYDTLKILTTKGLVSSSVMEGVTVFQAADPQLLLDQEKDKIHRIQASLPDLKALSGSVASKSTASFFAGKMGVKAVLDSVIQSGEKQFLFYGSRVEALKVLEYYPYNVLQRRIELGIRTKGVLDPRDVNDASYASKEAQQLSDFKFHNLMKGNPGNVFIYGDKVAFMTTTPDLVGCIIHNKDIAESQRRVFEIMWHSARRIPWPKKISKKTS